ncbi:glycosyl hydrolase family 61-domain-containing protein [Paraphoma chrysanthemicola]|uniref:lytic cellulose monooxygenase (C4-dehydrogenating) n=1 Tax=Paraphoma chrysanthemicola TaxID=798071 RepID=A0A8K0W336_9PLEO|nr:glycosyl hydrolase family 61-domain-containing protein [Paraphoma chrysanthemicola]
MHLSSVALGLGLAASVAQGHYVYPGLTSGSVRTPAWTHVRRTVDMYNMAPVQDVTTTAIRCNVDPAFSTKEILTVQAGTEVGFWMQSGISHTGPLFFYLAKVPAGQTAATWDGSGSVWFKIYEEKANTGGSVSWPNAGTSNPKVTLPKSLPNGDYLLRVEHIAMHGAYTLNGAQHYLACGQITVTGGGSGTPGPLVSFPGAYKPTDPGILYNMYASDKTYINPGPKIWLG